MATDNHQMMKSVGIDIGTTTTQIVISNLVVKNIAPGTLVPRLQITDKVVVYKSDIYFTPMKSKDLIDAEKLSSLVSMAYQKAGIKPEEIDTGAVIITGETAKKENARQISQEIAKYAGDFVVATAGGNLESIIAGKGSGASDYSKTNFSTVCNIDIGGGTSNVAIFKNGKVMDQCCINVGGRLMQVDPATEQIIQITEPMQRILDETGAGLKTGDVPKTEVLLGLCRRMAEVLVRSIRTENLTGLEKFLMMTEPLRRVYPLDAVMISGGVADFVYRSQSDLTRKEVFQFGDLGPMLGQEVRTAFLNHGYRLEKPTETIRATVIGAGARTVDVSGSTISVNDSLLPLKNIPVVLPFGEDFIPDAVQIAESVKRSISSYFREEAVDSIAIGIQGIKSFTFEDIQEMAKGLLNGMSTLIRLGLPLIVVLDQDCAKVLGQTLRMISGEGRFICIDQIEVNEGDYIDIGKSIAGGTVVPVVIKTLIFESKKS